MTDDLRRRAEERARETSADRSLKAEPPASEQSQLLHDLHVHQIELEMQNEELRSAQAALETSRARYFDLYDLAPVAYLTISEAGLIVEANLTAATLFRVPRGALVKQPFTRFLAPEDQDRYYLHRKRLFATSAPQVLDLRLRRGDHAECWARLEATIAADADGVSEVCRAVLSDITEQKRIEEERLLFQRELQQAQKVDSLARMAGAIAHTFNNQLAVVMGNLELAMFDPAAAQVHLDTAMQATLKAAEVSGLMLTYLGQTHGNHAPLDLSEACSRSLPMLRAAMPAQVALETDLLVPGPAVNGNVSQLQLVLSNLVTNAWEASCDLEATIRVAVTTVDASDIPMSHRFPLTWKPRDHAYACLEVADTGCGVESHEIERIFDPFFTSKFTGRGLGLPVVLGVVHAHSGGVVVETRRGRQSGSVFRVYLPVSTEQVERSPVEPGPALPEVSEWSGTVLVVEDDEMLRWTAKATLTQLGFSVVEAKDGLEAIEVFSRHRDTVRLVLCDLTMPHMDGWETLTALRKLSPGLPVILTSGYDEADVMAEEKDEQPQAFLAKPYSSEALCRALARTIGPWKR